MLKNLQQIFPDAQIRKDPLLDDNYECFFDSRSNQFIALPKDALTPKEKQLLKLMLEPMDRTPELMNYSVQQKQWYEFLFHNKKGSFSMDKRVRFIHFQINGKEEYGEYYEALQSLVQEGMVLVWTQKTSGVIIENESKDSLLQVDFQSMAEAFLTDFYIPMDFYIGRFYEMGEGLRSHFQREQTYFRLSKEWIPQEHIYTFEKSFPFVLMAFHGEKLLTILKEEFLDIFQDPDLLPTIKTFLENNSNLSSTAKTLYMHRNSLQYRIDKFIEKTSIDIKKFQGALAIYILCLYGENFLNHEIV